MLKVDRKTMARLKKIAMPFFTSEEKWKARGLVLLLVGMLVAVSGFNVLLNIIRGAFTTALSLREKDEFFKQLYYCFAAFAVATPIVVYYRYCEERLGLFWRKWLSRKILQRYFANRAYYHINYYGGIDNPDQRIEEDIRAFTTQSLSFFLIILNSIVSLTAFVGILWTISINLVIAVIGYAVVGSILTYLLGRPLISLNFTQLKKDADFRYKLVNIRDNSESIAFLGDEPKEYTRARQRLKVALDNLLSIINWNRNLSFFTSGYNYLIPILPIVIVAPLYFEGKIEFGVIDRAVGAFGHVLGALSIIVLNFGGLSSFAAVINRLGSFWEVLDEIELAQKTKTQKIIIRDGDSITFDNVTIKTPKEDQILLKDISLNFAKGGLLITGPSGSGKSSTLRVISGLWDSGSGTIIRPPLKNALFLPQRPYMILGSLRNQLLYTCREKGITDRHLLEVLRTVGLEDMMDRVGGFDSILDWQNILSTGEQQRLSFARLLLTKPRFAILDEATTALDRESEEYLYGLLKEFAAFYISVGYRSTLGGFHDGIFEILPKQQWKFELKK